MSRKKNPLDATSDPATWTRRQWVAVIILSIVVLSGAVLMLKDPEYRLNAAILFGIVICLSAQKAPDESLSYSWLYPLFRYYSMKTSITIPLASICMFLARLAFFPTFLFFLGGLFDKGFMAMDILYLASTFMIFLLFRILLETLTALATIARNTQSLIDLSKSQ